MRLPRVLMCSSLLCLMFSFAGGPLAFGVRATRMAQALKPAQILARDREAASLFAPIFYQALGDKPRSDYITNFDFDGDWRGDNNWTNAENLRFTLEGHVYYSVSETSSHIFIHYGVFHPRDYKGGERKGPILSELMREGARRGAKYDPTELVAESSLAHENDMEGCLIVVAKNGSDLKDARVVFVETLHHNIFSKYVPGETVQGSQTIRMDGAHVLLYIEPRGHGIEAYDFSEKQTAKKRLLVYRFAGKAEAPKEAAKEAQESPVGYDLVPMQSTLWLKARMRTNSHVNAGMNATYGAAHDYGNLTINVLQPSGRAVARKFGVGKVGSAFRGEVGGRNMAKPPWAWADRNDREQPLGLWFFDPAQIIKRDFKLDGSFSTTYVRLPFWAAGR